MIVRLLYRSLDLSFNLLRKVPADQLDTLKAIKILYFIQNKISHIDGLNGVADTLESVEFGGNKLRVGHKRFRRTNQVNMLIPNIMTTTIINSLMCKNPIPAVTHC